MATDAQEPSGFRFLPEQFKEERTGQANPETSLEAAAPADSGEHPLVPPALTAQDLITNMGISPEQADRLSLLRGRVDYIRDTEAQPGDHLRLHRVKSGSQSLDNWTEDKLRNLDLK